MNKTSNTTAHSEVKPLQRVFLKSVAQGFISQESINKQWQQLNYLQAPDYETSLAEYAAFVNILRQSGSEIQFFEEDNEVGMDSIYCRDASIITDYGVILCNMGKALRSGEPHAQLSIYEKNEMKILGSINGPGMIEGGDVAWINKNTLAVGHGYRSNLAGYNQLKNLLEPFGIQLIHVPLPHYKGPEDVFHLMSIFSPVDEDLAVVYSPLMPVVFRNLLIESGYALIEVPPEEFDSLGCNVLALSPKNVVMVAGNPMTQSRLEAAHCTVHVYDGKNISVYGGGGPTCLTRPIDRKISG